MRLYNPISKNIDTKAFHGWRRNQLSSQEDNVSHQFSDLPSMSSEGSNDARTDETNEADGERKNVKEDHTTASMVLIEKKIPLALRRLKDFNAPVLNW